MKHEGIIYHPECFKDKDNVVDTSLDSTMDKSTIEQETVVTKIEPLETMETDIKPVVENMETEAGGDANTCDTVKHEDDAPMEESTEPIIVKKELSIEQPTEEEPLEDASDVKHEAEVKTEDDVAEMVDTAEEKTESLSANASLVSDDNLMLAAPVVPQPKVVVVARGRQSTNWSTISVSQAVISFKIYIRSPSSTTILVSSSGLCVMNDKHLLETNIIIHQILCNLLKYCGNIHSYLNDQSVMVGDSNVGGFLSFEIKFSAAVTRGSSRSCISTALSCVGPGLLRHDDILLCDWSLSHVTRVSAACQPMRSEVT